jgi:c-di-GMP-binding flagellar brake protein YcgR
LNPDLLSYYEAIEQASAAMLEAARSGNWDEVVKLEGVCVLLISQLRHAALDAALVPEQAQLKSRIMQRILVNDAKIRTLAEPWLNDLHGLLRQLVDSATVLNLSAPDGSSYTTTLWTVDPGHRKISLSADAGHPQLQGLLDAGEAAVVGYLDTVKLQFDLHSMVLVRDNKTCALQADMPSEIFRFQRRLAVRAAPLPSGSPVAHLVHPSLPETQLDLRVLDVSIGGCALLLPDNLPPLQPGVRMRNTIIELDPATRFEATLQLQHVTSLNSGSGGVRLGCEMQQLSSESQRALQRYIGQTQKRRRQLSLG